MLPVVSEIVGVSQRIPFGVQHIPNRHFAISNYIEIFVLIPLRFTPTLSIFFELVKVAVGPAHYHLEGAVKAAEF